MASRYLLGFDVGSSSVKASLVNADSGKCVASAFFPEKEAPIKAVKAGWAEQDPQMWWDNAKLSLKKIMAESGATADEIKAIGISYQMHGLVCVDKVLKVLRPAIIWCDSRAVPYGEKAFQAIGADKCLSHLLNSPGNFTAAKLAWVKENEPDVLDYQDFLVHFHVFHFVPVVLHVPYLLLVLDIVVHFQFHFFEDNHYYPDQH